MKAYLVNEEIEELQALKQERINYGELINHSELNDLKKYLEKNGKTLNLKANVNANNVYDISFNKHQSTILESKYYKEYREKNPSVSTSDWKAYIFGMNMDKIDPDGYRIYVIAQSINLEVNRGVIEARLNQLGIENFDIESFLLNKDFDFTPYTIKDLDKKEYESIADAAQNILNIFDGITKNLSEVDKEVFKNNFFQMFEYVIKNVSKNDIKTKNNVFRNLLNYINGKRNKK